MAERTPLVIIGQGDLERRIMPADVDGYSWCKILRKLWRWLRKETP